jgi:hypothetical protein
MILTADIQKTPSGLGNYMQYIPLSIAFPAPRIKVASGKLSFASEDVVYESSAAVKLQE